MKIRVKRRLFLTGVIVFTVILNIFIDMNPKGIKLKNISPNNMSFTKTKFIINFYGNKIIINDDLNKVITLNTITKDNINITIDKNYRLVKIVNRKVELRTERRTLEILNNKVKGIGRQLFGITKRNVKHIIVDKNGYFVEQF